MRINQFLTIDIPRFEKKHTSVLVTQKDKFIDFDPFTTIVKQKSKRVST